ncbi:J domain-containing protein [Pseudoduganella namucuonensis]|uniref:DnaJ domain-containing protein n=1 Tax=Pseudoduganella namucuonensis TaxID=1035707 RepID=A0A1I7LK75_9BURK|nr:J domain-containing protein [Pseudoduganella namucuonensis]SFV10094.1 DnaJ domain-containing protein [Pseudoduganella namucuonensis]
MGKIHSHYDNLKVARMAPQEVIRAAYKALSQKYHPDKNPGDEKAARIMAIINSAYGTLSDPQKRKEHDEWIAAEEWEIEWLESTRGEDGHRPARQDGPAQAWPDMAEPRPVKTLLRRNWKWCVAVSVGVMAGWVGGVLSAGQPRLQAVLAAALGNNSELSATVAPAPRAALKAKAKAEEARTDPLADSWAVPKPHVAGATLSAAPAIKVVALSQVVLPGSAVAQDCEGEPAALMAPNGEPWPAQSGYVDGFPVGNKGEDMQLTLDNANNPSAVFIKVYDLERKSNVRYAYVLARDTLVVDKLATGRYEIRYQNLHTGADRPGCRR